MYVYVTQHGITYLRFARTEAELQEVGGAMFALTNTSPTVVKAA